jgi:hypothetical protein
MPPAPWPAWPHGHDRNAPAEKPLVLITTLGTTEASVRRVRQALESDGCEVMVFHSSGAGGPTLDRLAQAKDVALVLDLSQTEILDHLMGGLADSGPDRGKAALARGIPTVLAPGNADFIIAGPIDVARSSPAAAIASTIRSAVRHHDRRPETAGRSPRRQRGRRAGPGARDHAAVAPATTAASHIMDRAVPAPFADYLRHHARACAGAGDRRPSRSSLFRCRDRHRGPCWPSAPARPEPARRDRRDPDLPLTAEDVAEIAEILAQSGYRELDVATRRFRLRVARQNRPARRRQEWQWAGDAPAVAEAAGAEAVADPDVIGSPLPGTFYRARNPRAAVRGGGRRSHGGHRGGHCRNHETDEPGPCRARRVGGRRARGQRRSGGQGRAARAPVLKA